MVFGVSLGVFRGVLVGLVLCGYLAVFCLGFSVFSFCFGLGFEFIMLSFACFCGIGVCFDRDEWVVCDHLVGFGFGWVFVDLSLVCLFVWDDCE